MSVEVEAPSFSPFLSCHFCSLSLPPFLPPSFPPGMRGLCNGLGPALFGLLFFIFHVNLSEEPLEAAGNMGDVSMATGNLATAANQSANVMEPVYQVSGWGKCELL